MKYAGMPFGMWVLFAGSFQKQLTAVLGYDAATAKAITKRQSRNTGRSFAGCRSLKSGPFQNESYQLRNARRVHPLHAAAPGGGQADGLLRKVHDDKVHAVVLPQERKSKFTPKDIAAMKATAALKAADRNPYSWNMEFYEYPDGSGYEGRFTRCGICVLMKELGLYDLTPALCHLDYTMSEAGGVTNFVRQYTLASGGPYCDCGYKKKG